MTKEDRNLLLIDMCARLPYGVKGNYLNSDGSLSDDPCLNNIIIHYRHLVTFNNGIGMVLDGSIKPYLLPLSSMTDEQKKELNDTLISLSLKSLSDEVSSEVIATYEIDFYNKNHFDYRGLIPKDLVIDATNLNIYGKRI